jgi:hypothetical protein
MQSNVVVKSAISKSEKQSAGRYPRYKPAKSGIQSYPLNATVAVMSSTTTYSDLGRLSNPSTSHSYRNDRPMKSSNPPMSEEGTYASGAGPTSTKGTDRPIYPLHFI